MLRFTNGLRSGVAFMLFALLLTLVGCGTKPEESAKQTASSPAATATGTTASGFTGEVKVGLVSPFSGSVGFLGEYMANSMRVEIDKINAAGGLLGKKVVLITRDDELKPPKSVEVVREFIEKEKVVLIVGPSFTSNALATKSLINQAKIINMLPTVSGADALKEAPYTFRAQDPDSLRFQEVGDWLKTKNVKKVGLIAMNDATGQDFLKSVPVLLKERGMETVASEMFRVDDQDVTAQVLKIKQAGAEAMLIGTGNPTYAARIAVAAGNLQYKPLMVGSGGLEGYTYADLAKDHAVGTVFANGYRGWPAGVPWEKMPKGYAEHVKAVIDRHGIMEQQSGVQAIKGSALPADAVVMWAEAVKRAGTFDSDKVKAELEKTDIPADQSPSGTRLVITPDNHESYRAGSLYFYRWTKKSGGGYTFEEVVR